MSEVQIKMLVLYNKCLFLMLTENRLTDTADCCRRGNEAAEAGQHKCRTLGMHLVWKANPTEACAKKFLECCRVIAGEDTTGKIIS